MLTVRQSWLDLATPSVITDFNSFISLIVESNSLSLDLGCGMFILISGHI